MSLPKPPKPAKLVISLFLKEKELLFPVVKNLAEKFGPVDMISEWFPFDYTNYYEPEMGSPLYRRVVVFKTLIDPDMLAEIKITTNAVEFEYSRNGHRMVNIDPGYMVHERFVLATGKNYSHRIYIGKGIYADLTLIYKEGGFQKLPWTYPDYADEKMIAYLETIRNKYTEDLKKNLQQQTATGEK
jgi:hypothetical protein